MKESTFFLLLFAAMLIIGLVGKLLRKESFWPVETSFFDRLYRGSWLIIPFVVIIVQSRYNYYRDVANGDRNENHIPCIESNMKLESRTKGLEVWRNKEYRNDSIWHKKEIDIDMTGIYSETDYFVNVPKDQTIVMEARVPGLFRSYRVRYKLITTADYFQSKKVDPIELDSLQVDSIMQSWKYVINYNCE